MKNSLYKLLIASYSDSGVPPFWSTLGTARGSVLIPGIVLLYIARIIHVHGVLIKGDAFIFRHIGVYNNSRW